MFSTSKDLTCLWVFKVTVYTFSKNSSSFTMYNICFFNLEINISSIYLSKSNNASSKVFPLKSISFLTVEDLDLIIAFNLLELFSFSSNLAHVLKMIYEHLLSLYLLEPLNFHLHLVVLIQFLLDLMIVLLQYLLFLNSWRLFRFYI